MQIALYVRGCGDTKPEEDCSEQIAAPHQWAAENRHRVVACFEDRGVSANDVRRPALQGLLHAAFARTRRFEAICVGSLDYLLRDDFALGFLQESLRLASIEIVPVQHRTLAGGRKDSGVGGK